MPVPSANPPEPAATHRPMLSVIVPGDLASASLTTELSALLTPAEAEILVVPGPSAFADAVQQARGVWCVVVPAGGECSADVVAEIGRTAARHDVDVVIGTDSSRPDTTFAAGLVKVLFPRLLATVNNPMSGLFAVRLAGVDLARLDRRGPATLVDILVRHPGVRVAELSYQHQATDGDAPATPRARRSGFVRHVLRLRRHRLARQLRAGPTSPKERLHELGRMVAFGLVGLTGMAVNTAALWFFYDVVGLHHLQGAALATQVSTTWNFLLIDRIVYRRDRVGSRRGRAVRFFLLNNLLMLARLPVLHVLVVSGVNVLVANAVILAALFLLRFLISDRVIYRAADKHLRGPVRTLVERHAAELVPAQSRHRSRYLPYRYHVAGVVTIGSQVRLPELEYFRAQWVDDADVDITIRIGDVGSRGPKRRAAMTEYTSPATLRYEEHLGRWGSNFRVELGQPINVVVGPLLAGSPHVVYTNVIEALLRFVMVSRGRMLLHSACIGLDGVGVMLSALTDTGKTGTVLRLLREHGGTFLSDDMTVIDATGMAYCFPKPLTISAHTLRAVNADDLTASEWRRLRWQSRLHSKSGRSFALAMSRMNVPILGINAMTQRLVPPPKYTVDRLLPVRIDRSVRVAELFVIERGAVSLNELDHESTVDELIRNTDDAYGFPPFRYLAPTISIGGVGYSELRRREREILSAFLTNVRSRRLGSDSFGWSESIVELLARPRSESVSGPAA